MQLVPSRSFAPEILDRPDNSRSDLRGAFDDIRAVNRFLGGRRALWLAVRPFLVEAPAERPLEVLDLGCGDADLPVGLVELARKLERRVHVTAIDRDPEIVGLAARRAAGCRQVRLLCADAFELPFADGSFDVATASLFLHHFTHDEIVRLLSSMLRLSRRAVIVNDLRRHLLPWSAITLLARVTRRHPMFVHDAPLSVLRGFVPAELERAARASGARSFSLRRRWPYRLVLTLRGAS